jgi:hypothetical protein
VYLLFHRLGLFLVFLTYLTAFFLLGCGGGSQTLNYQQMDIPPAKDSQSEKLRSLALQSAMMACDPDADYIIGPMTFST